MPTISRAAARRTALAAQGFAEKPHRRVTAAHLGAVMTRLGVVQVDSVNVLTRAHYLPFFSRLGPYDRALLDTMRDAPPWPITESWAHMASLIPQSTWPLLSFRHAAARTESWGGLTHTLADNPGIVDQVLRAFEDAGPLTARECEAHLQRGTNARRDHWGWNWSTTKTVIEYLFRAGRLAATGRTTQFERSYDLPSRVLWSRTLSRADDLTHEQARRELISIAARALGVATRASLADYFRMRTREAGPAIDHLVATGELQPVEVTGAGPHLLHAEARRPHKTDVATLVSPFDSLIWHRPRTEQLFGMRYRIGIYTPRAERTHGYYVLPFVLGNELVARVDLKADRAAHTLRVQQLTIEPDAPTTTRSALDGVLHTMADWLALESVSYAE